MEQNNIDPLWPNSLRWFLVQNLHSFIPWHLIAEPTELNFAARAFAKEDTSKGEVFVFARRQDCDDFAGLEIVNGVITEKVICFHPVFSTGTLESSRSWNIVNSTYKNTFEFISHQVIPDMQIWAELEDASDLKNFNKSLKHRNLRLLDSF